MSRRPYESKKFIKEFIEEYVEAGSPNPDATVYLYMSLYALIEDDVYELKHEYLELLEHIESLEKEYCSEKLTVYGKKLLWELGISGLRLHRILLDCESILQASCDVPNVDYELPIEFHNVHARCLLLVASYFRLCEDNMIDYPTIGFRSEYIPDLIRGAIRILESAIEKQQDLMSAFNNKSKEDKDEKGTLYFTLTKAKSYLIRDLVEHLYPQKYSWKYSLADLGADLIGVMKYYEIAEKSGKLPLPEYYLDNLDVLETLNYIRHQGSRFSCEFESPVFMNWMIQRWKAVVGNNAADYLHNTKRPEDVLLRAKKGLYWWYERLSKPLVDRYYSEEFQFEEFQIEMEKYFYPASSDRDVETLSIKLEHAVSYFLARYAKYRQPSYNSRAYIIARDAYIAMYNLCSHKVSSAYKLKQQGIEY